MLYFLLSCLAVLAVSGKKREWAKKTNVIDNIRQALTKHRKSAKSGVLGTNKQEKIVLGTPTTTDVYPWMAALMIEITLEDLGVSVELQNCGSSIITEDEPATILTAAHCLYGIEDDLDELLDELKEFFGKATYELQMHVGRTDINDDVGTWDVYPIDAYIIHEDYDPWTLQNDVAVIRVDSAITGYDSITLGDTTPCCNEGDYLRVIGWGAQDDNKNATDTLEYAELVYADFEKCQKFFCLYDEYYYDDDDGTDPDSLNFTDLDYDSITVCDDPFVVEGMLCAVDDEEGACFGDSGGPLITGTTKEDPQVGVVSWGYDCGDGFPHGYADVGYYSEWIEGASACLKYDGGNDDYEDICDDLCGGTDGCGDIDGPGSAGVTPFVRFAVLFVALVLLFV